MTTTTQVTAFPPILGANPKLLILGSMPGAASLAAGRYYAHPSNAFWPIVTAIYGIPAEAAYDARCRMLTEHGIAVWDVLKHCERNGSLDSAIQRESEVANDFVAFFASHPSVRKVCFNGAAARLLFSRHADARRVPTELVFERLPSTSPAYASLGFEEKLRRWRSALGRG